ncbi:MAG: PilT/PilU family type 4a pilus ATPase [Pseudomonadota bacterium]
MAFSLKNLTNLLQVALQHNASDIHLRTEEMPCLRIRGDLIPIQTRQFSKEDMLDIAKILFNNDEIFARIGQINEMDGGFGITDLCRMRYNFFRYSNRIGIVLRIIKTKIPNVDELGIPTLIDKIADCPRGLVLVTGATGSGKSTTLAAMIHHINISRPCHIVTIEDPIEYVHTQIKSRISQREVGLDTIDFPIALRSALRQDPDVILIGEMRDTETISTALKAAETGHTVFSTVHTTDAITTIGRIISMFPSSEQEEVRKRLAENLYATIGQRLLSSTKKNGLCVAMEIMINGVGVKECITGKENINRIPEIIAEGRGKGGNGSQTFDQHLMDLFESGLITKETALEAATSQSNFLQKLLVY